jgi:exosortase
MDGNNRFFRGLEIPRWVYLALLGTALLYAWGSLFYRLSKFWFVAEDYQYGWAAPVLMAFTLYRRRKILPPACQPMGGPAPFVAGLCACLMIPTRVILEANPDWRAAIWWSAGLTIVFTFAVLFDIGGLNFVRHFTFPVLFVLTAVPWPYRLESPLTITFMKIASFISSELLNLFGAIVVQRGTVLETQYGPIGIDEACSGIKSFQAMLLLGLFLSELSGLRGLKRFYPVLLGWVFAFTINIGRMIALALIVTQFGLSALESWHDTIGTTAFVLTGILLVGAVVRPPTEEAVRRSGANPLGFAWQPCCVITPLCFLALFAGGELLNWWWYDTASAGRRQPWTVRWSSLGEEAKTLDISKQIFSKLQCDSGSAKWWFSADGHRWIAYFFEWEPGIRASFARNEHAPEICLPASGRKLMLDNGYQRFFLGDDVLSVRHQVFDDFGQPLNVFFIMEGSGISNSDESLDSASFRGRLRSVLRRSPQGDRRSLELIAEAYETPDAAWNSAESVLSRLIVRKSQTRSSGHEADTAQNVSCLFKESSFWDPGRSINGKH